MLVALNEHSHTLCQDGISGSGYSITGLRILCEDIYESRTTDYWGIEGVYVSLEVKEN
jgi:hypothetical protein